MNRLLFRNSKALRPGSGPLPVGSSLYTSLSGAGSFTNPSLPSLQSLFLRMMSSARPFRFAIDRGGTFTDVYAEVPGEPGYRVLKLLSEDPSNYPDAPREGIRRILEEVTGKPYPRDEKLDASLIDSIRMGTTVATNALLERKGAPTALVITKGFKDLLHIGNQSRPKIFDLEINTPEVLHQSCVEVDERVVLVKEGLDDTKGLDVVTGTTGESVAIREKLNEEAVRKQLQEIYDQGIRSLAVCLMHAYTFPHHEEAIGKIAKEIGFSQVALSSEVMPMTRIVPRGYTTSADAYLTPHILKYVTSFQSGFKNLEPNRVLFMQSDGGMTPVSHFTGHRAILSGPAGGVVGYALTTYDPKKRQPVVGFDMGGTSTDVSRYDGNLEHVFENTTAGVTIQSPQLDINTVAAGGGSRLFFRSGLFVVGPESAGAHPGPVCYRKGGYLAVTDANLQLGRILPEYFPKIFGPEENEPLDADATKKAFEEMQKEVNAHDNESKDKSIDEIAYGFIRVANEAMCRPIRALTQMKGYDITTHILACFGGAGGQHACAIASALGMKSIFIHRFAGILSAYGMGLADVVAEKQHAAAEVLSDKEAEGRLATSLVDLAKEVKERLAEQGFKPGALKAELFLNLRYQGTDTAIMTHVVPKGGDSGSVAVPLDTLKEADIAAAIQQAAATFEENYSREFGFTLSDRDILVDDVRVRGIAPGVVTQAADIPASSEEPKPHHTTSVYFAGGRRDTPVYLMQDLQGGQRIQGPALVIDKTGTMVVEPEWTCAVTADGNLSLTLEEAAVVEDHEESKEAVAPRKRVSLKEDPIQLAIFSHRFMGIAEQMGRTLQRTSISVNIKERLDFSCALFGPDGGLVANAPHIPVHLGAMQEAVRYQLKHWGDDLKPGDVLVSNHPQLAGGSHLPDITVMTPVFKDGKIVFFVASRGHHADIGGIAPGSMPPLSKTLAEEGAAIVAFKLVENGKFQEEGITELLMAPGKNGVPGSSGSRNLKDSLSDLKAQVAANQKGIQLVDDLIDEYGLKVVHAYMNYIQRNAATAVREMLKSFGKRKNLGSRGHVYAEEFMDDGTPLRLRVTVTDEGRATFDFTGTGPEVFGNCNAPPAVTYSAIIYALRCLVGEDIPLNQGCLEPIDIHIPDGTILKPSEKAAVVGGNVLTSQRVVDVVLKAFGACAASQGCMNNLTFGDDTMGYYETIAGGAGAGPTWHGRSGVHTHMTNTRITDPETLERRYPVNLLQFSLRKGSGGAGAHRGGDGVVRELEFRKDLTVSILSERRAFQPYGLQGGKPGARGMNLLHFSDGRTVSLGGKNTVEVDQGAVLEIRTPGGGGFGAAESDGKEEDSEGQQETYEKKQRFSAPTRESGSVAAYAARQLSV